MGATTALGQITPDNTLGKEKSVVTPNVYLKGNLGDLIEGGAIRESNLFHSFSDFNVPDMGRVYFDNPAGIQNILTRVTGTKVSNILGTLGVLGDANLFLINPNGIVFGPNSSLDLGGSFFGTTADRVLFEDGTEFSAKNPNGKPLLTINIPSRLQFGSNPGSITNHSSLFQVPNVQTLGLIGGEVTIPGGRLRASDGRIELGSVGPNGLVNLIPTDTSFGLDYSAVQEFQDISLSEGAFVDTSGEGGGSIQLQGAKVSLRDRSFVFADTLGSQNGGGIVVEASQLSLEGGSRITADVLGSGQGGDLSITTGQLIVKDGAQVSARSVGLGDGGNLTVDAEETVQLIGTSADGQFRSGLFAEADQGSIGNAGNLSITTGQLIVSDGAVVSAFTVGEGDGGNLTVNASESVQVIGTLANNSRRRSSLLVQTQGTGKAGNVSITTGQLIVSDGAIVSASALGLGEGGNLTVDASESVQLIGTSADGRVPSGLFAQNEGTEKGKDVKITTGQLIVKDGAVVSAGSFGLGDGGNLTVDAEETVQVIGTSADGQYRSALWVQTQTKGNAGELKITTGQLIVKDGAVVSASTIGEGDGGDLSITTEELIVKDGAQVLAGSFGLGDGGNLTVDASESVQLIGTSADGQFPSGLFTRTQGTGNAGELLKITTGRLIVKDGAVVSARTLGEGDGGILKITTGQLIVKDGALVSASTLGEGDGGNLKITTGQLIVKDGAVVSASTLGEGDGGDLSITTEELIVKDGGQVSAGTFGQGDGGNLTVDASESVQLIGTSADGQFPSGLFSQTQGKGNGNAGELLKITTGQLIVKDGAVISTGSAQPGSSAGTVEINANSIFLNNKGIITAETAGGDDSNINLYSRDIRLLDESKIITNARNTTTGGNITIDTDTLVGLGNSDITANAEQGRGGRVEIKAQGIFGLEFRDRLTPGNDITSTSERGPSFSGEVILNTPQVDPTSGLTELPASLVDAEAILANDLCGFENNRIAGGSSFTITGKGGLPPTRLDPVINTDRTVGWRTRPGLASSRRQQLQQQANVRRPQPAQEKKVIIEAQGWVTAKDGTIILTAHPFRGTPVEQILPNLDCNSGRGSRE
ncbi:MAG: filamentous hemagglutinin N-terminal domain-containing protein [Moorea sp. SIOASIH]|uniref:two-partner secretion domain-containing protein n=1 Tax=Moorena sp. SIOASIH TaxID=2607817 RepID=UPI0013B88DF0|nr:filamentous hemagglutinin N-terminal domain-containing protein [Moorena sp. SIOASIH]NEO36902.1 filamentous hemagglutinin N-terminal domain-containing protein [Moorena sp. SIOASIH]